MEYKASMIGDLVQIDLTGRKFVCLGRSEWISRGWAYGFRVGGFYYEAIHPEFKDTNVLNEKHILYLYNSFGDKKLVDAIEFKEVGCESTETRGVINRVPFCLN